MEIHGCRATGLEVDDVDITGYYLAYLPAFDEYVLWTLPGGVILLPLFSTVEKLRAAMAARNPGRDYSVRAVADPHGFLDSLVGFAVVGVDPHDVDGRTRFMALDRSG